MFAAAPQVFLDRFVSNNRNSGKKSGVLTLKKTKASLSAGKVMASMLWMSIRWITLWKAEPLNYCTLLRRVYEEIIEKHPRLHKHNKNVLLHQNNTRFICLFNPWFKFVVSNCCPIRPSFASTFGFSSSSKPKKKHLCGQKFSLNAEFETSVNLYFEEDLEETFLNQYGSFGKQVVEV